jgi:hypothetical protein
LKQQILKLEERLRARRAVLAGVLQVMHSHTVAEPVAFALIRRAAMEQRKTIGQMFSRDRRQGQFAPRHRIERPPVSSKRPRLLLRWRRPHGIYWHFQSKRTLIRAWKTPQT